MTKSRTGHVEDVYGRPLRDLRISVTDRCNFRCTYCMPAEIFHEKFEFMPHGEILSYEEIARLTRIIVRLGAVKLRLTGGEPLVRRDLEELVKQLSAVDGVQDIAMTTNGVLLPKKVNELADAGLKRVTISLDSIDEDVFQKMNGGRATVAQVKDGLAAAQSHGLTPVKVNCVVKRGVNDHTIVDMARFCKDNGFVLRFIEYMDVGTMNGWRMDHVVPAKEIIERVHSALPLEKIDRNHASETALRYRYQDGAGEIGVIASVTIPFCGNCSRMRLSPEGKIYTCLFATEGTDLKKPMRDGATDDELEQIIRDTWGTRIDRYSEERSAAPRREKVEMYYIGG